MTAIVIALTLYIILVCPLLVTYFYLQKKIFAFSYSERIVEMVQSVDEPCNIEKCFSDLERYSKEYGIDIKADFRNYMK